MTKAIRLSLLLLLWAVSARGQTSKIWPVQAEGFTQPLNGEWSFKYVAGHDPGADAGFRSPDFDVSAWKKIKVPANWELQGFAEPRYSLKLEDGLGLYRRTFRIPAAWRGGRRVCLRFEGVAYGFQAWVNDQPVGGSKASAYNPSTFDITDALAAGADADNTLAVQVVTRPLGYEFDINDDWSLSGIFRDVTVFSVPSPHVEDVSTRTRLAADGTADLSVAVKISQPEGELRGKLSAPDAGTPREFALTRQPDGSYAATVSVPGPRLWTAETPALYHLQLSLAGNGRTLQTVETDIGLREVSIRDGVLLLNGRPIKLRGVNHHDIAPESGRAITVEEMRRDLELMQKGNINFVRTSHYPPNPRFLDLCDRMGFYVLCEVSIGKGEEHLNDPAYHDNILARADATVTRDKNHASVIAWSIGNENPDTAVELEAARRAKELDPSRPVCIPKIGSHFAKTYEHLPEYVDIYAPHYPSNSTVRDYAGRLKRPVIFTEYAHAWGLAMDRVQDQWEIMQHSPRIAGGAIWHFMDQGILRSADRPPTTYSKPLGSVWLDKNRFYDTSDADGCDGIVYSDRTPQADFWEVRKVYSPVQIAESAAAVRPGKQEIALTVENRHDFRPLEGFKLAWSLQRNGKEIQRGESPLHAASHEKETPRIAVDIPADAAGDVLALDLRCVDAHGAAVIERTVRLDLADARRQGWADQLPAGEAPRVTANETEVKAESAHWVLTVARASGALTITDRAGHVYVAGIYPHAGRKLTMAENLSATKAGTWRAPVLTQVVDPKVEVAQDGAVWRLSVSGSYPRPEPPAKTGPRADKSADELNLIDADTKPGDSQDSGAQSFVGGYRAEIRPNGTVKITYDFTPAKASGKLTEAGLSVLLPPEATELRWIGQGIYPGYPGKDRLNEFGLFHLNREDLRFQGNRRGTELALLTTPAGVGVALVPASPADVAVERDGDKLILSHNAVISGLGNKGSSPETAVSAGKTAHVAGSFTLVPLGDTWPGALTRWFDPHADSEVFHPFYHSYDQ